MSHAVEAVQVRHEPSTLTTEAGTTLIRLRTDQERQVAPCLSAELAKSAEFRDAMGTLYDILTSDLRYKQRDRGQYLEYLRAQGRSASKETWEAEKAFLEEKYGEAVRAESPLDPLISIDQHSTSFEVFSADASAYARLTLMAGSAYRPETASPGTASFGFDENLARALTSVRSYRSTRLDIKASEAGEPRSLSVPHPWLRAFGQLQAAATLPAASFELNPVDLYNVLFALSRMRAKKSPRALSFELVPGQAPRMVLEPWDIAVEGTASAVAGTRPMVTRTWGRRRLLLLARVLPHVTRVRVQLLGSGQPAFYILELGHGMVLTLALSGWTDSGWAGLGVFDSFMQGEEPDELLTRRVLDSLSDGPASGSELAAKLDKSVEQLRPVLASLLLRSLIGYDVASGVYSKRPLLEAPPALDQLRYRDEREARAERMLAEGGVKITKIHEKHGEGVQIEGEAHDKRARRSYLTSFTIDAEGRTLNATCTSPEFRRSGLREGPTAPMIALRLLYGRQRAELERARRTPEGRKLIRAETRTFIRREANRTLTFRVSLDGKLLTVCWGSALEPLRQQRCWFEAEADAHESYFSKLDELGRKGFIDASASELV